MTSLQILQSTHPILKLASPETILSSQQVEYFEKQGYLLIRDFYSVKRQILPVQKQIHRLIGLLIDQHQLNIKQSPFQSEKFDSGYQELIQHDRNLGGVLYDAVKQIPSFVRLVADPLHEQIVQEIRDTKTAGIGVGGSGIRIDNPSEDQYRAAWHQDYPSQLRSSDGIVFWSPLVEMTEQIGPVELCPGSHSEGLIPLYEREDSQGAYALRLQNEQQHVAKYSPVAPLLNPGDLLLIDYRTIHRSGSNQSSRSRWSMQIRYFNFEELSGRNQNWIGGYAAGNDPKSIHPELFPVQ